MIDRVLAANTDNFTELVAAAGLSPAQDFRHCLLRGVDFAGSSLKAFDFTWTIFESCRFEGARLGGAILDHAQFPNSDPSSAADWNTPLVQLALAQEVAGRILPDKEGASGEPALHDEARSDSDSPENVDMPDPIEEMGRYALPAEAEMGALDHRDVVRWLVDEQRHPVLLLGRAGSGKTALLLSLLDELQRNPQVATYIGNSLAVRAPRSVVTKSLPAYHLYPHDDRELSRTTSTPFFVPIDIGLADKPEPVRLALLEYAGELLDRDWPGLVKLPDLVEAVLNDYPLGLSVLFLAPVAGEGSETSDSRLASLMDSYMYCRPARAEDRHLMVLTKWDAVSDATSSDAAAGSMDKAFIENILGARFPMAWRRFHRRRLGRTEKQLAVIPYSAKAWLGRARYLPGIFDDLYSKFLLNWLFHNATTGLGHEGRRSKHRALYPDVGLDHDGSRPASTIWRFLRKR
jgi:hypothetical protein